MAQKFGVNLRPLNEKRKMMQRIHKSRHGVQRRMSRLRTKYAGLHDEYSYSRLSCSARALR
jgi:hypothetical protein